MGKQLDGRSDIYALGVLAYEMITGRLPFPDAKGPAGLITAQLRQVPEPPSSVNMGGHIPAAADEIILKMLAKTPEGRFDDVSVLREVCLKLLAEPQRAVRPGQQGSSVSERPAGLAAQQAHQMPPPPPRAVSAPPLTITVSEQQQATQPPARSPAHAGGQPQRMPPMHASPQQQHMQQQQQQQHMQQQHMQQQHMQQQRMQPPAQQDASRQPQHPGLGAYATPSYRPRMPRIQNLRLWLWIVLGIIALGGVLGAVLAYA
jgi:serine/threonine protein kinase